VTEIPSATDLHTPRCLEELVAPGLSSAAAACPQERARLDGALELVSAMLDPDPTSRISAAAALEHRFVASRPRQHQQGQTAAGGPLQ
jgi:serine/threonine protein kinase